MGDIVFHDAHDGRGVEIKQNCQRSEVGQRSEHLSVSVLRRALCSWRRSGKGARYEVDAQSPAKSVDTAAVCWQLLSLLRRLATIAATVFYIATSIQSTLTLIKVLRFTPSATRDMGMFQSRMIPVYAGATTIRYSPLVFAALNGSTEPINETIYLDGAAISRTGCTSVPAFNPALYSNTFLRFLSTSLFTQTAYNLTFLDSMELIAPVVDCYWDGLLIGTTNIVRAHYLMRNKVNTDDVALYTLAISFQDYSVPAQNQKGPAGVAVLQIIRDMASTEPVETHFVVAQSYPYAPLQFEVYQKLGVSIDHNLRLRSIPAVPSLVAPQELFTSIRTGFYINTETEQSNIRNTYFAPDTNPILSLSRWHFEGGPVLRDTWGWVHAVHALFAIDGMVNLVFLLMIVYRNFVLGKIWIGDAFVSVSNTLATRGLLILGTWVVNDGWTLMQFCYQNANEISQIQLFYSEPDIIHADFMTLFLSLTNAVAGVFGVRIDPALVIFMFELGFRYRIEVARAIPPVKNLVYLVAIYDLIMGTVEMSPIVAATTPVRLWTVHPLFGKNVVFILSSLLPTFVSISVIILYAILRKIYRRFFPEKLHILKVSDFSEKVDELKGMKRTLTLFEVATGAALQSRVGVVSDYENCLFIKGSKYASADGIYCNGYVIANDKWLIATRDLVAIFAMKLTHVRFKTVYVYEVVGHSVKLTARLLYPHTIPWGDLLRLNISTLL